MDVAAWLRRLGLEQYATAFRDNDVDGEVLPELTSDDLISIGVTSVGHRRKLLAAISALGATPPVATVMAAPRDAPAAHSGDCDRPFQPKVITDSGDRDHVLTRPSEAAWGSQRSAPSTRIQVAKKDGAGQAAEDRPWSPRRGPARVAQCPHERRSGARGEALWAPVGDQCTGGHAAGLSLATRRRRSDGPLRSMRWARWMMRSRMASARVGSPMTSCQRLIGTWLVTSSDPLS